MLQVQMIDLAFRVCVIGRETQLQFNLLRLVGLEGNPGYEGIRPKKLEEQAARNAFDALALRSVLDPALIKIGPKVKIECPGVEDAQVTIV